MKFIGTFTLLGGERLGRPNLSPIQNIPIFLFIFSVFWIMLLFDCLWTLMNDLFQRKNQVFKPTSLSILLHCGVGKDWADRLFSPS